MDFRTKLYCYFLSFTLLLPAFCFADDDYVSTRATYYGTRDGRGTPTGACGYGEYGRTVNDGQVSGVSRLYRNGGGCGSCYQVRCKNAAQCTEEGTTVVATDYGEGDNTDFILSIHALRNLANNNQAAALFSAGVIDVEYKRVPCQYQANLLVKVHEHSNPHYLSIVFLNQGGIYDITAVELSEASSEDWTAMRRAYGAVWDMGNPPEGELAFRFQVTDYVEEAKWVQPNGGLPSEWEAGVSYDTSYQLT